MAGIGPTQPFQYLDIPIFNALFPKEGPKAIPVPLNFALQQSFTVDLTILQQRGFIKDVQSVFVDNSLNTSALTVLASGSNMPLKIPGSAQGVLPIFAPNPPVFTISCAGGQQAIVYLCNIPLPAAVWPATAEPSFNSSGYLQVTDPVLDATVSGNNVNVIVNGTANNNVVKPIFQADELFTGSATTSAAQTITTGAPSFFITEVNVRLTGDAGLAGAAEYTLTLKDGATTIAQGIAILATSGLTDAAPFDMITLHGIQYNSKTNAANLTLTGSANLTAGKYFWNIAGGLCSNIGP